MVGIELLKVIERYVTAYERFVDLEKQKFDYSQRLNTAALKIREREAAAAESSATATGAMAGAASSGIAVTNTIRHEAK